MKRHIATFKMHLKICQSALKLEFTLTSSSVVVNPQPPDGETVKVGIERNIFDIPYYKLYCIRSSS